MTGTVTLRSVVPMEQLSWPSGPPAPESAPGSTAGRPPAPRALRWLLVGAVVGIALLVALPLSMLLDQESLARAIMADQPDLDPAHLDVAVAAVLVFATVLHAVDVALTIWFVVKVFRRRRWARVALTAYLVMATVGSLFSAAAVPGYLWAVIPGDGMHLLMLAVLWLPASVRRFFAGHRASDGPFAATQNPVSRD